MKEFSINGSTFYYIVEKGSGKPLQHMLENKTNNTIGLCIQGAKGRSYGSMSYEKLEIMFLQNHHFYEILNNDARRIYFDIEYCNDNDPEKQLEFLINWIKEFVSQFTEITGLFMTNGSGIVEKPNDKWNGKMKHSYHIILHTKHYLDSLESIYNFKKHLLSALYQDKNDCYNDYSMNGFDEFAIDTAVYSKNQNLQLPYQSKFSIKPRIHKPMTKNFTLNDYLVSPINLKEIAEPLCLKEPKNNAVEKVNKSIDRLKKQNDKSSFTDEDKKIILQSSLAFDLDLECNQSFENNRNEWDGTYSVYSILKLIPNSNKVSYNLWFAIMCAIKRSVAEYINGNDSGLELFLDWSSSYRNDIYREDNIKAYNSIDIKTAKRCYGFNTLLLVASYCCPALKTKNYYIERLQPSRVPDEELNEKYINFLPYLNKNKTIFIKSPMGSGKSYGIHSLPENTSCIFLSSRQAFANSQSADFEKDNFVNYLDDETSFYEDRIIISLESIHRLKKTDYDYLIIDESESIFNIISSQTLIKGNFAECIKLFESLIKKSKYVVVMDAFISERSFQPIQELRKEVPDIIKTPINISKEIKQINDQSNINQYFEMKTNVVNSSIYKKNTTKVFTDNISNVGYYIENKYPAPERTATYVDKNILIGDLINKLNDNKRCVFVCGSRTFAEFALEHIKRDTKDKKILFYNCYNRLPLKTNVKKEWKNVDLLIYTPSITCGISYSPDPKTEKDALFDNLYIYAVNTRSAHFRDIIQASRRCRHFNSNHILICLNTKFKITETIAPTHPDIIKYRNQGNYDALHNIITDVVPLDSFSQWVSYVDTFNKMETNIHSVYLQEVCDYYLNAENIKVTKNIEHINFELDYDLKQDDSSKGNDIRLLTHEEYDGYTYLLQKETLTPTMINEWKYYLFHYWLKPKYRHLDKQEIDTLFDEWNNAEIMANIKRFKGLLNQEKTMGGIAEHINKNIIPLHHLYQKLSTLGGLKDYAIDLTKTYTKDDLLNLGYGNMVVTEIHNICQKQIFNKRDIGTDNKVVKYSVVRVKTILNALLNKIGYQIVSKTIQKRHEGKMIKIYSYMIEPEINEITKKSKSDILEYFNYSFINYDVVE